EWVHVQLHQQKGMISLSPPTICNSALGDTIDTFGNPYRYRITGEKARVLTQFCIDNLKHEKSDNDKI
ncbi:hypothetical protein ACGE6Z_26475, partial [Klebsiella pneumoniae]|uniref:hypothetical protein n=1 Tax=Klebsiella pneumoniae TaxID=573 RepID=UPI00362AD9D6